ncbi:MAG: hypothetical protein V3W44_00685 [Dehalococcoidales bacterium]
MALRTRRAALPPLAVVRIAGIIIRAVKEAAAEVREAKQADSDGGKKITPEEALEIVEVVFAAVMPDLIEEISRH